MEEATGRAGEAARGVARIARDYERHNRAFWDADADGYQAAHGAHLAGAPAAWGAWRIPESELGVLGDVTGCDVLELGCGGGQWSTALVAAGVRAVGLDLSAGQLRHAHKHATRAGVDVPLVLASGERVPLRDASFDVVLSDHGAASFCDPERTLPEVARLLRPGGLFAFCGSTPLLAMTWDTERDRQTRELQRKYFGMRRLDFDEGTIDFVLPTGEWLRLFQRHGFTVEDLLELRAPKDGTTTYDDYVDYRWARRWPAEQIWKVRKISAGRT
ncbi:MAG: class I SAM-dependent methyltransferase [Acidimicrobiia bacterium]